MHLSNRRNLAFNVVITFPCIWFLFKETKGLSLEDIDLLFGDRALGALPENLEKEAEQREAAAAVHEEKTA
jgi:hypothetical protein